MNALLNYPGAKWGMAAEIVALMPPHRSYLEPFFGSGAVLFNKPPSAIETVNDIDGDITNFFKVLREQPERLAQAIALTPYSRDVFNDAHENRGTEEFDRAYRFAIRSKMGHGFKTYQKTGFKIDIAGRQGSYASRYWAKMPELVQHLAGRLKEVQIENRPALDIIRRFNFDKAKGGPLVDRKIRGLSWVILRWAMTVRPRVMMMENVEEIQTWGPLMNVWIDGHIATVPDPDRKGETFDAFIAMLTTGVSPDHPALEEACEFLQITTDSPDAKRLIEGLGYVIEHRELVAADCGAPTTRKRFVLVARCDGKPIVWPERTHAPRDSEEVKSGKLKPWRSAAEIIDWTQPGYSIFASRKEIWDTYGVRAQRPLKPNTLRRIIRGVDKFTIKSGNPFIVPTGYGERKGQAPRVQDLADPLGTVVAKEKFALCQPVATPFGVECNHSGGGHIHNLVDPLNTVTEKHTGGVASAVATPFTFGNTTGSVGAPASDPVHTVTTSGNQMLGVPVMAPFVAQQKFSNPAQDATNPLSTITSVGAHQVVEPLLVPATFSNTGGSVGDSVADPVHTIRTAGGQVLASANLMSIGQTGGGDRIRDMREPVPTTVSKQECCAVAANLIQYHTAQSENVRGQGMDDPVMTVDSSNRYGLASCNLVEYYGNGNPIDVTDPLHTVTAHDREGLVCAHIDKYFAGGYKGCGDSADAPLSTVTVEPRHGACAAHVVEFKGQDIGQSVDKPLRTITASWGEFAECRAVLTKAPGRDLGNWPQIRDLLNEYCGYNLADDEVILLIIHGIAYYISDITLRMLTPRELYNAMGFPSDYVIEKDYNGNVYPKDKQVARCGNAVCPPLAEAMVRANLPEWCGARIVIRYIIPTNSLLIYIEIQNRQNRTNPRADCRCPKAA